MRYKRSAGEGEGREFRESKRERERERREMRGVVKEWGGRRNYTVKGQTAARRYCIYDDDYDDDDDDNDNVR